jgi:hypothetical protein
LSELIEEDRGKRSAETPRKSRRGKSKPGGIRLGCGCRYARTGGDWYHVTPCRAHVLREWPVSDEHMILAAAGATA